MNWTKWSSVAEIVSSVAVVATLVYLTIQTQQNTAAIQANSRQAMVNADLQVLNEIMDYPSIYGSLYKETLTLDEIHRLDIWLIELVRTREFQLRQYQQGLLDERDWEAYKNGLISNLSFPRTREWWNRVSSNFDGEFVNAVNEYLKTVQVVEGYRPVFLEIQEDFE